MSRKFRNWFFHIKIYFLIDVKQVINIIIFLLENNYFYP